MKLASFSTKAFRFYLFLWFFSLFIFSPLQLWVAMGRASGFIAASPFDLFRQAVQEGSILFLAAAVSVAQASERVEDFYVQKMARDARKRAGARPSRHRAFQPACRRAIASSIVAVAVLGLCILGYLDVLEGRYTNTESEPSTLVWSTTVVSVLFSLGQSLESFIFTRPTRAAMAAFSEATS